jgi:hypothetical protein
MTGNFYTVGDLAAVGSPSSPGENFAVIFDKMQGGPTIALAESHMRGKELEELLPVKQSRES